MIKQLKSLDQVQISQHLKFIHSFISWSCKTYFEVNGDADSAKVLPDWSCMCRFLSIGAEKSLHVCVPLFNSMWTLAESLLIEYINSLEPCKLKCTCAEAQNRLHSQGQLQTVHCRTAWISHGDSCWRVLCNSVKWMIGKWQSILYLF